MLFPAVPIDTEPLVILAPEEPPMAKIAFADSPESPHRCQVMNDSEVHPSHNSSVVRPCGPWLNQVKSPTILLRIGRQQDESIAPERGLNFLQAPHGRFVKAKVSFRVRQKLVNHTRRMGKSVVPPHVIELIEITHQFPERLRFAACSIQLGK